MPKYDSYDSGYTFELEQGTARTAYLFELTSPDANGDTFTLYNKYPLEQEGALVHVPNDTDDYTQLEDFIYYYAQRRRLYRRWRIYPGSPQGPGFPGMSSQAE